jgi:hypothetical protein
MTFADSYVATQTESKDLIDHPWFGQLMDHKYDCSRVSESDCRESLTY